MTIAQRFERTAREVAQCCVDCGRNPSQVRLIAVSKTVDEDGVREAYDAGARDFGENRPDQLVPKAAAFPNAAWHFIGNIQSRRIADIVGSAALIHSVFDEGHARKISAEAVKLGKVQDILLEVNVSGEQSKSGVAPEELPALVEACRAMPGIRLRGLMTMAPQGDAPRARRTFEGLAALARDVRDSLTLQEAAVFDELSMGMSEDWREAIAAGATMVRIGRAVFSDEFQDA